MGGGFVLTKLSKAVFFDMRQQKQRILDPDAPKWYRGLVDDSACSGRKEYSPLTLELQDIHSAEALTTVSNCNMAIAGAYLSFSFSSRAISRRSTSVTYALGLRRAAVQAM